MNRVYSTDQFTVTTLESCDGGCTICAVYFGALNIGCLFLAQALELDVALCRDCP